MLLVAGIVGFLSWHHRLRLFNDWLAGLDLPIRLRAGGIDWQNGAIRLGDVRLRSLSGEELGSIKRADISVSVNSVRRNAIDAVRLEGVRLGVKPEQWSALVAESSGDGAGAGSAPAWQIGRLSLVDAAIDLAPREGAWLRAQLDWNGGTIAFSTQAGLKIEKQTIHLKRLEAHTGDGGAVSAAEGLVEWEVSPATRTIRFSRARWADAVLNLTPQLVEFFAADSTEPGSSAPLATTSTGSVHPAWVIEVEDADLGFAEFAWRFPGQTAVTSKGSIQGNGFRWDGDWASRGHRIRLDSLVVSAPGAGEVSRIEVASAAGNVRRERGSVAVLSALEIAGPSVRLAADLWGPPAAQRPSAAPEVASSTHDRPLVRIEAGRLTEGTFEVAGVAEARPVRGRPAVRATVNARAQDLTLFADGRVTSPSRQTLAIEKAEVAYPKESPVLRFARLEVEAIPDEVAAKRSVSRIGWSGAEIRVDRRALDRIGGPSNRPPEAAPTRAPAVAGPAVPWWHGLSVTDLAVADARVTATDLGAGVPDVSAEMAVTTDASDGRYRAVVSNLVATAPAMPETPVLVAAKITLTAHPSRLWQRRLDALEATGVKVGIGPAIESLASASGSTATTTAPVPAGEADAPAQPGWHLDRFSLADSQVEISNMVPLLDPVTFKVSFALDDVPLTAAGLRAQNTSQRIEVSHIRLNSAYGHSGSLPVAELDHLFVAFSLAGLLDQRLDRVEVIGPTIYVGEQLFWYVDYFRKYASRGPSAQTASGDATVGQASTDPGAVKPVAAAAPAPDGQPAPPKRWSVDRIDAHFGKFVLALKGSVIDAMPPLPFSCSTQLEHGRLDLVLDIPRDTYRPSTRLPLEVDVLEGTATFNLPLKEQDNNLVQVFKASELRYKKFRAHNVFLSMTYDRYGVYARFGGNLYGGYLSGGGDLYLDDNTSWDGWLSGKDIDLGPLTSALTPKYFSLTGVSEFNATSFGDLESLYTATGTFTTTTPGHMTIHALTPLKQDLPSLWSQLQRSLTERGVETLRDFPYDECRGAFKLFHQEGDLTFKLAGPLGTRGFQVSLHDHRGSRAPGGTR